MGYEVVECPQASCEPLGPFRFLIRSISLIIEMFSGLISMPRLEMMKPYSFPIVTPNTHFSRLSLMWLAWRLERVSSSSLISYAAMQVLMIMSSM